MRIEINGAPIFFDVVGSKLRVEGPRMAERPSMLVLHGGPGFDHATMRPRRSERLEPGAVGRRHPRFLHRARD